MKDLYFVRGSRENYNGAKRTLCEHYIDALHRPMNQDIQLDEEDKVYIIEHGVIIGYSNKTDAYAIIVNYGTELIPEYTNGGVKVNVPMYQAVYSEDGKLQVSHLLFTNERDARDKYGHKFVSLVDTPINVKL